MKLQNVALNSNAPKWLPKTQRIRLVTVFQFEANTSTKAFIRHVVCDITLKTSVTVKPSSVDQRPR